ncbi:phage tail protein [Escherichia coli]|nr:phage tail protein [Escherichia coli]MCS7403781.1 phage tail protein [Escherichia coli]MDU9700468.1 phage tail protein [Escherichia coli]MDU9721648.1 phage tail protein [Escherichia coli]HCA4485922.1 phage tail protein [Escherichia coli]HCR5285040.1 phage tail protein [Escherichia coli]
MPFACYFCIFINVGLGEGAPAIGVPFFWPSAAMPNTVIDSWSSMVFLKFNGAKFSATDYPVLAKVFPSLVLPEARGDFIRIWDDGRGVDSGRALLSAQSDDFKTHEHKILGLNGSGSNVVFGTVSNASPLYTSGVSQPGGSALPAFQNPGGTETRPRNIAFNFLVRAK